MLACDSVKDVKTPERVERDQGMRAPVEERDERTATATARMMTPFENTSRSPRLTNCRGRKPSRAMK